MTISTAEAPVDSAPNTSTNAREREWKAEIHTPDAEYNANVPIDLIEPDPKNREVLEAAVAGMAASIKSDGLLQPIVLSKLDGGKYRIIAGEHRWRAFKLLKRETIPARIYKSEDELSAARKGAIENFNREQLTPVERARKFKQLQDLGMKQKEIGAMLGGISQPVIANALRLLELPAAVQEMVNAGELTEAHGVVLCRFARWPRVCACIGRMAREHGYSSKDLHGQKLPFAGQCVQEGLMVQINTGSHYAGPLYVLPPDLAKDPDFIATHVNTYYVLPEDPNNPATPNKWAPVQERLDRERVEREAASKTREAKKAAKSGGMTDEQKERKRVLEKNKAQRIENLLGLGAAVEKLKRTPAPTTLLVAILTEKAIAGGFGAKRLEEAAEMVGVKLPSGVVSSNGGHGLRDVDAMRKMDAADLARFAVAVLLAKEVDDANRNAWALPKNVEAVMNSKVSAAASTSSSTAAGQAELIELAPAAVQGRKGRGKTARRVVITDDTRYQVKRLVEAGRTGAEIAKEVGISLPSVQNIKKALGFVKARASARAKKGGRK